MKRIFTLLVLMMAMTIVSCDVEFPSSGYQVYFTCDMAYHPFDQINHSFGQFITVKRNTKYATSYDVTDANGVTTTHQLPYKELFHYGLGGLIIGTPSMCDGKIWVYDWACPACETARYRLDVARDGTGYATCPNCHNVYDLNSGGILINGKSNDRELWNYRKYLLVLGTTISIRN